MMFLILGIEVRRFFLVCYIGELWIMVLIFWLMVLSFFCSMVIWCCRFLCIWILFVCFLCWFFVVFILMICWWWLIILVSRCVCLLGNLWGFGWSVFVKWVIMVVLIGLVLVCLFVVWVKLWIWVGLIIVSGIEVFVMVVVIMVLKFLVVFIVIKVGFSFSSFLMRFLSFLLLCGMVNIFLFGCMWMFRWFFEILIFMNDIFIGIFFCVIGFVRWFMWLFGFNGFVGGELSWGLGFVVLGWGGFLFVVEWLRIDFWLIFGEL